MQKTIEIPIKGMDCTECTMHVKTAIASLPGVSSVEVLLAAEKAIIQLDPAQVKLIDLQKTVEHIGYSVPTVETLEDRLASTAGEFTRQVLALFTIVFGAVLFVVIIGEWLGYSKRSPNAFPGRWRWPWCWQEATRFS